MIVLDLCQLHYQILLIIYLECIKKVCMETKKIKSKCDFIGFKKNKVNCKCKACRERYFKSINGSIKNFPNTNQFCNGDLNKLVLFLRKKCLSL